MPGARIGYQVNGLFPRAYSAHRDEHDHDRAAERNLYQPDSPLPIQIHFDPPRNACHPVTDGRLFACRFASASVGFEPLE